MYTPSYYFLCCYYLVIIFYAELLFLRRYVIVIAERNLRRITVQHNVLPVIKYYLARYFSQSSKAGSERAEILLHARTAAIYTFSVIII